MNPAFRDDVDRQGLLNGLKEGRPLDEKADRARLEVDHACFSENILFQKTIILILENPIL